MVMECMVIGRRVRSYETRRGTKVIEDCLVLVDASKESPLNHSLDFLLPENQRGGQFAIASRLRLAVTEITTSEFGKRIRAVGDLVK